MIDLSGAWNSYYRYPNSRRGKGEFWSKNVLMATQKEQVLTLTTTPDSAAQIEIKLTFDPAMKMANGTWRERTDPTGDYNGAVYEGTIEVQVSKDGTKLSGTWHGKGRDGVMNSGSWELSRTLDEVRS